MSHMSSLPVLTDPQSSAQTSPDPSLFSRERQATFLAQLAATGQVRSASARAGVSHQTAYRLRLASPGFRRAWDAALVAARAQAEEMLACRAIEGWEEDVIYHGEVVATRRRFSDRLLLAHLARLDKLCGDAEVAEFADAFDFALERYAAGEDRPAREPEKLVRAAEKAAAKISPGAWSRRSKSRRQAQGGRVKAAVKPCPECGGKCLGPERKLTRKDCQWLGNRLDRMDAARPRGAYQPHEMRGNADAGEIEAVQLAAFEAGAPQWWRVVPAPAGAAPGVWHYASGITDPAGAAKGAGAGLGSAGGAG